MTMADPMLEGVGYYEFKEKVGIPAASFAGRSEIVFYGQGMSHMPSAISVLFWSSATGTRDAGPPKLCK